MIRLFAVVLTLLFSGWVRSQHTDKCHLVKLEDAVQFESWLQEKMQASSSRKTDENYQIPVVIHILHNGEAIGEGANISDEQIASQLRVINEDFRRMEGTRGYNTHPDGADARIEFILARSDPDHNATDGIVRVDISQNPLPTGFAGNSLFSISAYYSIWDPHSYLNIWTFPGLLQNTILGQAIAPQSDLPGLETNQEFVIPGFDSLNNVPVKDIDGVVVNTHHFGEVAISSGYNLGRTLTHEIGHFLGLEHIWGSSLISDGCETDDFCKDTPNVETRTVGCPTDKKACDGSPAMIENYMDYTDDRCMNIFTNDQVFRMRTVLENSPRRKSLLTSKGLLSPDQVLGMKGRLANKIKVYPNPLNDVVYLEAPYFLPDTMLDIAIHDFSGKCIATKMDRPSKSGRIKLDFSEMAIGSFLILIMQNDEVIPIRVVKNGR